MGVSEIKFHSCSYSLEYQRFNSLGQRAFSDILSINYLIFRTLCLFTSDRLHPTNRTVIVREIQLELADNQPLLLVVVRKCPCQIILKHQCLWAIQRFCNVLFSDNPSVLLERETNWREVQ